ncbi:hypothetical protein FRACA_50019 [Frankia canadensis]|uniref:Uncharacterized protein n=1 Tax=Frankia canadensis TaxID=1836972 RepID=A0A2I2KY93_9ACTN|nr:hypothetical protein FRACA_50019 [Frankia canadensis]SOU57920.1 hypothetical protein FRACA_50019 [Frankia canadensis]
MDAASGAAAGVAGFWRARGLARALRVRWLVNVRIAHVGVGQAVLRTRAAERRARRRRRRRPVPAGLRRAPERWRYPHRRHPWRR